MRTRRSAVTPHEGLVDLFTMNVAKRRSGLRFLLSKTRKPGVCIIDGDLPDRTTTQTPMIQNISTQKFK